MMMPNATTDKVNILLVDDQPAKLLVYEAILSELGENLVKTYSAREALQFLLKNEVAVVVTDVCMPELDGFQLVTMIHDHPSYRHTPLILVSAVNVTDMDRLRGYESGAVDYIPVPIVPEILRSKVRVFVELFRKTRELQRLNSELERRIAERTTDLTNANTRLVQSEDSRTLALAAGQMGSWEWDLADKGWRWDEGQYRIFGVEPHKFRLELQNILRLIHPDDLDSLQQVARKIMEGTLTQQIEFRVLRPDGAVRWCIGAMAAIAGRTGALVRLSGVTIDITDRKEAEEHHALLAREVDHRARNALTVIQSIIRLTRAKTVDKYVETIEGRINAMSRAHTLLSESRWMGADLGTLVAEELAPYRADDRIAWQGPNLSLQPQIAQGLALVLHELATNAAKHGALSSEQGRVNVGWELGADGLFLRWTENGGPPTKAPIVTSFGLRAIVATIEQQLGGKASFDWDSKGLRSIISIPRSELIRSPVLAGRQQIRKSKNVIELTPKGRPRILLVETATVEGMTLQATLSELGFQVIGPVFTQPEAFAFARDSHLDAAVLSVDRDGALTYGVAKLLKERGVPFVFVTDQLADGIDGRFTTVPILQRPVEREQLRQAFS